MHHPESLLGKALLKLNSRTSAKSHAVAYSISKLNKVVNLTTWCYTPFTISQIRHALEILLLRQLVVLPGTQNLQTSISKPFACPSFTLACFFIGNFSTFPFSLEPVFEDIEQSLHPLQTSTTRNIFGSSSLQASLPDQTERVAYGVLQR